MSEVKKVILVVEDDKGIRDSIEELLQMEDYQVVTAGNGKEALDILNGGLRPGLILLDLMMPVMDGFAFRQAQRAIPELADIPIVVMSADGNVLSKKTAIGARDYIKKPLDIEDLLQRIAAWI